MVNKIKKKPLCLVILGCCTYFSGYAFTQVADLWIDLIVMIIAFLACILLNSKLELKQQMTPSKVFIICMLIALFFSYILNIEPIVWFDYLILIAMIFFSYFVTRRISFMEFASMYSSLMSIISFIAVIVGIMNSIGIDIPGYTFTNGYSTYATIWICTWTTNIWSTSSRIVGVFWEAGLYASMTLYALIMEGCFTGNRPRKSRMIILTTGVLFSQSAAGYILLVLVYYILFTKGRKNRRVIDLLAIFITITIFLCYEQIISWLVGFLPEIFWKLDMSNSQNIITQHTRFMSPILFFNIFLDYPFFGAGYNNAISLYHSVMSEWLVDSWTSTTGYMLAAFGILGISYTVFLCRGVLNQKQYAISTRIILCAVFLIIVNKEPHNANMFTYIIMFYLNDEIFGGYKVEQNCKTSINDKIKQIINNKPNRRYIP